MENHIKVKILFLEKGIKQKDIAQKANVSTGFVSSILSGKDKSRRVQAIIANILNKPYKELWG